MFPIRHGASINEEIGPGSSLGGILPTEFVLSRAQAAVAARPATAESVVRRHGASITEELRRGRLSPASNRPLRGRNCPVGRGLTRVPNLTPCLWTQWRATRRRRRCEGVGYFLPLRAERLWSLEPPPRECVLVPAPSGSRLRLLATVKSAVPWARCAGRGSFWQAPKGASRFESDQASA